MDTGRSDLAELGGAAGPGCRGDREWFGLRSSHVLPLQECGRNGIWGDVERLKGSDSVIKKGLPGPARKSNRVCAENAGHGDQAEAGKRN